MRAALNLLYNNIYAKLDNCVPKVQYLFKDLTGFYHPNYLTSLYLGMCVGVRSQRKNKKKTAYIRPHCTCYWSNLEHVLKKMVWHFG